MIVAASGNVPWWTKIIVGVIATTGGPLAVYFQSRHQEVATKSDGTAESRLSHSLGLQLRQPGG